MYIKLIGRILVMIGVLGLSVINTLTLILK